MKNINECKYAIYCKHYKPERSICLNPEQYNGIDRECPHYAAFVLKTVLTEKQLDIMKLDGARIIGAYRQGRRFEEYEDNAIEKHAFSYRKIAEKYGRTVKEIERRARFLKSIK